MSEIIPLVISGIVSGVIGGVITGIAAVAAMRVEIKWIKHTQTRLETRLENLEARK